MKNKKVILLTLALSAPLNAHAGFPQIDAPSIAANIWGNIQKIGAGIQNSGLMDQALTLGKEMFSLENMAQNNAAANVAARQNAAKQQVQNIELMEQMAATPNVCEQVSFSFAFGDIGCKADESAKKNFNSPEYKAFIESDSKKKNELANKLVKKIQATNPELFDADEDGNPIRTLDDKPVRTQVSAPNVYSTNANALFSSADAYMALDYDEYSSMSDFISLIVPDHSFRSTLSDLKNMNEDQQLVFMSLEARRAVPDQALRSILSKRTSASALAQSTGGSSGNETSELFSMSEAIKNASSESAIYAISVGETSTVSQLYRHRVLNLTRAVELQLEQFKAGLEYEGLLATKLAFLMDK